MKMKKMLIGLLAAAMITTMFTACDSPKSTSSKGNASSGQASSEAASSNEASSQGASSAANSTPAGTGAETGADSALSALIDKIYENKQAGLMVGTLPVDLKDADALKAYTGLSSADLVDAAAASEAMIGSQAYSLVLVRVKDSANTEAVAKAMKEGINPRKWICVEADDLRVVGTDKTVMLIMVSSELKESVTADAMVEAFTKATGGTLSVDLK